MKKTVYKVFFAWGEEKEAAWLEEMGRQGWHLTATGLCSYHFIQGEPVDYNYRFDFNSLIRQDRDEYFQLFDDAGWEHCGTLGSWYYFRKRKSAEGSNDIFTDRESLIKKYRRLLLFLYLCCGPNIFNTINPDFPSWNREVEGLTPSLILINVLMYAISFIGVYGIIRIHLLIRKIKKHNNTAAWNV